MTATAVRNRLQTALAYLVTYHEAAIQMARQHLVIPDDQAAEFAATEDPWTVLRMTP